ncbi:hypothetical protein [Stenotrophomonas lactitubi]|uniref:hypothetical protein n=1 Tax=Stenotrophomonas lactitubi TaxID=2045214 RepID=UPI001D2D8B05|nr:hypothetical protein [Stenotrophomonas lactitubi]CAH0191834.1 hypothetical protein SRABI35_01507 [Stenotrophomonas lactitubi]
MNACSLVFAPPLRRARHCLATAAAVSLALGLVAPERAYRQEHTTPDAPDAYGLSWSQAVCTPLPAPSLGLQAALEASGESSF